ncbi:uncharacterized protein LOC123706798 isoform X2 [Pieris brassicae]|uniref:uncharacterized protein LOC123706798 isoform X2 n=1 Tax=Pieris brassicae TaxID=7116 RepID=UPI001E661580|nr:uncharacterized protein LOC123706798 isoform X2 [Pieris brassicae]
MLLLLFLFQQSTATVPHQEKHIIKTIDSCPDVGYFFQRDSVPNALVPGPCLLCFCKENTSAVCWRRDNSRCDHKSYRHYGKREKRQRRSPGFSDIFFRDATRDVFDRRTPEQCKPYESSFSEGCPPADWCIGCTVCDCDANGRWDCHILSFCPDKKGKKQVQKRKRPYRSKSIKRSNIKEEKSKKKDIFKKIPPEKITQRGNTTKKFINKTHTKKSSKRSPNLNGKSIQGKKVNQVKKTTKKIQKTTTKKAIDSKTIKKKSITNQQIKRNAYKEVLQNVKEKNDTYKLAEAIVKKVMSSVEKLMNENQKILNTIKPKILQKRQMPKQNETKMKKSLNKTDNNFPKKHWIKKIKVNKLKDHPKYNTRDKRSISTSDSNTIVTTVDTTTITLQLRNETKVNLLDTSNISAASTKIFYYKYDLNNSTMAPKYQTKIETLTSKIDSNHSMSKANVSLNHSIFNDTDNDFIKQLHDLKIKHNNFIASRIKLNDKWKDLHSLLSREYNKRMYKKYKENATESNIINVKNQNTSCGKVCSFKKVFNKIIYGTEFNSTDINKAKIKKISLVTTLKNFFKPLLTKIKPRTKKFIHARNNKNVLSTLCRKFELCKPDLSDKLLRFKLTELNRETQNIFKIVGSIKGLLYLLNTTGNSSETEIPEVEKLDQILRELYMIDEDKINITQTKRIQIKYVKRNTQEFVKSLEKFAFTLKDIIHILQKQNKTSQLHNTKYQRNMRCAKHSINRKQNIDDKLTKLKKLLLNYNLLQNKFMSKMYDVLTSSESHEDGVKSKVSEKRVFNNSSEIETYSRNIIENLRKLQIIGQKLSSRSRVKRNSMGDDDAIDYLLVLMEYLLKQNKPVVNPQVSDGIDLLIDAIKNAPDIKPITLNAVRFTTFKTPTRTTDFSDNSFSSRAHNKNNKGKHYFHTKTESFDDTFYDPDEKNNLKGNVMDINIMEGVTPFYNNKIKENNIDNTEIVGEEVINSAHVYFNKNPADTPIDTFLKENSGIKSSKNKYEVYNADDDEEDDDLDITPKKLHRNKDVYMKAEIDIEKEREKVLNHLTDVVDAVSDSKNKNDTIYNQDWEIDNIDLNLKVETTTKVTLKPKQVTRTARRHVDKYTNPISGMSSEELENHSKPIIQSTSKLKKIDIFSSFDYNTERTDVDSESKEDKNDAFSDFV